MIKNNPLTFEDALAIFNSPWIATEEGLDQAEDKAKEALEIMTAYEHMQEVLQNEDIAWDNLIASYEQHDSTYSEE